MIEQWDDELPPKVPKAFCPHCGAPRTEGHSFCPACGKPFDTIPPTASVTAPTAVTPSIAAPAPVVEPKESPLAGKGGLISALLVFVVPGILVLVYLATQGKSLSGTIPNNANLPPVGAVWFGTSFDSTTFEIRGQSSSFTTGTTVALVAHLSQSISSGQANIRVTLGGQTIANTALNNISGSGDVFGVTFPLPVPGSYTFTVTDLGGNTLASGTVTAQ